LQSPVLRLRPPLELTEQPANEFDGAASMTTAKATSAIRPVVAAMKLELRIV
jgi:hypothetical protein